MTDTTQMRRPPFWKRYIDVSLKMLSRRIDHADVVSHVREEGQLSGRYLFMVVMSCAIAILGLLLSSPAVVIGAMLISPLMGPIMLMGFSFSIQDFVSLKRAGISLLCGVAAALAISITIVTLSPLSEATPEILARTRPNLFDLLVAIFSGLAGGYAVINRKGETIVGVAIATALMPPLAVTGYGVAQGAWHVAGGAFFLFMTNLLAISLSVTVLSRLYGFLSTHGRGNTVLQSVLIFAVFAGLSVPLGLALRDIAYEATVATVVKDSLLEPFNGHSARISDVNIAFPRNGDIRVDATVLTRSRVAEAEELLTTRISERVNRIVNLNLDQVLVDEDKALESQILSLADSSLAAPLRAEMSRIEAGAEARINAIAETLSSESVMRNAAPFAVSAVDIDVKNRRAIYVAEPSDALNVGAYRVLEAGMASNHPDWMIEVKPPVMELPLITFDEGAETPNAAGAAALADSLWALQHWDVQSIEVVGYASTSGQRFDNTTLAYRRALSVAEVLKEEDMRTQAVGEFRAFNQRQEERDLGRQRFQTVLVRPATF